MNTISMVGFSLGSCPYSLVLRLRWMLGSRAGSASSVSEDGEEGPNSVCGAMKGVLPTGSLAAPLGLTPRR